MQTFNKAKKERDTAQIARDAAAPFTVNAAQAAAQSIAKKANPTLMGSGVSNAAVPAVGSQVNKSGKTYDPNVNYMQRSMDAAAYGNLAGAMYNERMHNTKDGDMGLGWGASGIWNYIDAQGLGGQREAKYNEIENYFNNGFDYDYLDDPVYQSILGQKEKEAEKAYNDGYAQLSTAFDGDIPVNMINKLLTTKSEIVDSADSYIPQLRQMAYDMYVDKGNQLYNQYGLLDAMADEDYNKFLTDRDFMAQGVNDAYYNKTDAERYADEIAHRDKVFNRGVFESDRDYERGIFESDRAWDYGVEQDKLNRADQLGRDAEARRQWEEEMKLRRYSTYN